jgi:transposase-like protein
MLAAALESEVAEYIAAHAELRDEKGRRLVSRNGRMRKRQVQTPIGPLEVHQPRVNDRRRTLLGQRIRFSSRVLPKYLRKTRALEDLVPWLYLKGVSSNDFPEALSALGLGEIGSRPTHVQR